MTNDSLNILEVRDTKVERAGALLVDIPLLQIEKENYCPLLAQWCWKDHVTLNPCRPHEAHYREISFGGRKIGSDVSVFEYRRSLAMVFQEPLLFNTTVFKNVASGLTIRVWRKSRFAEL